MWTSPCAITHGHFCSKMMSNFSLQFFSLQFFSLHFGDKTFWWVRRENTWVPKFIFLPPHPTEHTPKSFPSYFLSKVFHPPYSTSKQTHPTTHPFLPPKSKPKTQILPLLPLPPRIAATTGHHHCISWFSSPYYATHSLH